MRTLFLSTAMCLIYCLPAKAQVLELTLANNSQCIGSDQDNDISNPVDYDPGNPGCYEANLNDLNVFTVESSLAGNGSQTIQFEIDAGLVVDANPASSEYQAGRIVYALTLEINGTGGASWELAIDQHMQGLVASVDDGAGSANASASSVTASLSLQPNLSFGSHIERSSSMGGSQAFSATRSGEILEGTGDRVLTGSVEITLDAYSECGGFLCLGWADEGAVLFGLDDISGSAFVSADEYETWGPRDVEPDGYTAIFELSLSGLYCGDGTTDFEQGEECDDGNDQAGDGCSATCLEEPCGDGTTEASLGEQCDDGNHQNEDGCSNQCQAEFCGDGILQQGLGEECDDSNTADGDGCSALCQREALPVPLTSNWSLPLLVVLLTIAMGLVSIRNRRDQATGRE